MMAVHPKLILFSKILQYHSLHFTCLLDPTSGRRKRRNIRQSAGRSLVPRFISFSMHQPLSSMVKDYSWMLMEAADRAIQDQSNTKAIIIDEPQEDDEVSQ